MRSVQRGLIITSVLLSPVALVSGCWAVQTAQVNAFYQSHELLNAMRVATLNAYPKDPLPLRQKAFYERIPPGTAEAATIGRLSSEGFACQTWNSPTRRKDAVDCFLNENAGKVGRWLIQLDFDDQRKLLYASIVILK